MSRFAAPRMTRSVPVAIAVTLAIVAATFAIQVTAGTARVARAVDIDTSELAFGAQPYETLTQLADDWVRNERPAGCTIGVPGLRTLVIAPTFGETGSTSVPPSPMTLSRYDSDIGLWSFLDRDRYRSAFWNPGVGMWQFDSAGAGAHMTAAERIDVRIAGAEAIRVMGEKYCEVRATSSRNTALNAAWKPWHACNGGDCLPVFDAIISSGGTLPERVGGISNTGGMVAVNCVISGSGAGTVPCNRVDPDLADGGTGWAQPGFSSRTPVTAPFHVARIGGTEWRMWHPNYTGWDHVITASRPIGTNARSQATSGCARTGRLTWYVDGKPVGGKDWRACPPFFDDIGRGHQFFASIEWMGRASVSTGHAVGGGRNYQPMGSVTRQAMAAFLYRLAGKPGVSGSPHFGDVGPGHQFFDAIQWMYEAGVSTGSASGSGSPSFTPGGVVTRQAMAAFLYRLAGEPGVSGSPHFDDVGPGHQFFDAIQWMYEADVSTGNVDGGDLDYLPIAAVRRQAMAAFLDRQFWPGPL